jgi:hypothetical protein
MPFMMQPSRMSPLGLLFHRIRVYYQSVREVLSGYYLRKQFTNKFSRKATTGMEKKFAQRSKVKFCSKTNFKAKALDKSLGSRIMNTILRLL